MQIHCQMGMPIYGQTMQYKKYYGQTVQQIYDKLWSTLVRKPLSANTYDHNLLLLHPYYISKVCWK